MLDELIDKYYGGYKLAKKLEEEKKLEEFNSNVENYINQFKERLYEEVPQHICDELRSNFEYSNPDYFSHYLVRFYYYGVEIKVSTSGDNWMFSSSHITKQNKIINKGDLLCTLSIELGKIKESVSDFVVNVVIKVPARSVTKEGATLEAIRIIQSKTCYEVDQEATWGV